MIKVVSFILCMFYHNLKNPLSPLLSDQNSQGLCRVESEEGRTRKGGQDHDLELFPQTGKSPAGTASTIQTLLQ
jgi:hypothetical protein